MKTCGKMFWRTPPVTGAEGVAAVLHILNDHRHCTLAPNHEPLPCGEAEDVEAPPWTCDFYTADVRCMQPATKGPLDETYKSALGVPVLNHREGMYEMVHL